MKFYLKFEYIINFSKFFIYLELLIVYKIHIVYYIIKSMNFLYVIVANEVFFFFFLLTLLEILFEDYSNIKLSTLTFLMHSVIFMELISICMFNC